MYYLEVNGEKVVKYEVIIWKKCVLTGPGFTSISPHRSNKIYTRN